MGIETNTSDISANFTDIACIVLAAGKSTRFGSHKLSHVLNNGKTILQQSIETVLNVFESATVVVSAGYQTALNIEQTAKINTVICTNAEMGMSASLKAGIEANLDSDGWLIVLGDMPYLKPSTLLSVCQEFQISRVVQPVFKSQTGHPVLFGRDFLPELLKLKGDFGAKMVINANQSKLIHTNTDDPAVLWDIDTPNDIQNSANNSNH